MQFVNKTVIHRSVLLIAHDDILAKMLIMNGGSCL